MYGVDDDKLGTIDDVILDHSNGAIKYVVIDTGGWLSSKRFLVPAERIHNYEPDTNGFQVDLLKKHIERFPKFDEKMLESEKDWEEYERRYRNEWVTTGDVLHERDSVNVVTPPPDEIDAEPSVRQGPGPSGAARPIDPTPRRFATGEVSAPTAMPQPDESTNTSHAVLPRSSRSDRAVGSLPDLGKGQSIDPGPRWSRFEKALSRCRDDITKSCTACEGARRVA